MISVDNDVFQELVLKELRELKTDVGEIKTDVRTLNRKMDVVYEQTAGLTEFKSEISVQVSRHELDIQLLKRAIAK